MLTDRIYRPDDNDVIYHYCSAATFQAIVESGTIRFSDINMMNDATEVRLAYSVFEEAATRLITGKNLPGNLSTIDKEFFDSVDKIVSPIQLNMHPFIACFSQEPNLLGQWRAYADDGRGFAVGFNAAELRAHLPATFLQALYDPEQQVREMMEALSAIHLLKHYENESDRDNFFKDCVMLANLMVAFKHKAFQDEREVRAVHVITPRPLGALMKFEDVGGIVHDTVRIQGQAVTFQLRDNHFVAFVDYPFDADRANSPLKEIVIGPKNTSAGGNLALLLGGLGYKNITMRNSVIPYR